MINKLKQLYKNYKLAFKIEKSLSQAGILLEEVDSIPDVIYVFIIKNSNYSMYITKIIFNPIEIPNAKKEALYKYPFAKITIWKYHKDYREGFIELN
jgi:hypothetical protein